MRYQGKLKAWKDRKGFGFIAPDDGGDQVFVHITSFINRHRRPFANELVTYEISSDSNGRKQAISVLFADEGVPSRCSFLFRNSAILLSVSFIFFVSAATLAEKLPIAVLGIYLIASTITFFYYGHDKAAAIQNRWRTQETTLHLFALVGGWPGALAAQRLFHHKSKKQSFQIVFWTTVTLNCIVLGWLFSKSGAAALSAVTVMVEQIFNGHWHL